MAAISYVSYDRYYDRLTYYHSYAENIHYKHFYKIIVIS